MLKKTCNNIVSCLVTLLSSETTLGVHTISATATYLPNGSTSTASKTVTKVEVTPPPVTAPQVTITSPVEGSVQSGDVSIATSFPQGAVVVNVETKIYLDGVLKNTCTGVATCAITIPVAQISTGTHTASATATHTPTGTTTSDSNTFTKPVATPPPAGGVSSGSGSSLITLVAPVSGAVLTAGTTIPVTATTTPEATALGRYIVLTRKVVGGTTTTQLGNPCYQTTCTNNMYVGGATTFPVGQHEITASLKQPNPSGVGWSTVSTVSIMVTKQ